jgi:hypothetical protein
MNKHLLLALLFIPMVACGDANADTVGPGSDVTLKRYIIHHDDFSLNEQGAFDPILIPVPAGSQVVKADRIEIVKEDECHASNPSVPNVSSEAGHDVAINCDNELRITHNEYGYLSIIIAY